MTLYQRSVLSLLGVVERWVIPRFLYHYAEERTLHRMPNEEESTATPSSRELIERFLKEKNAAE